MKRVFCAALAIVMLLALTGCSGLKMEDVVGVWETTLPDTEVQAEALLLNVEAYEEEIALADLTSLEYVKVAEFREDELYEFRVDAEGTKVCVRSFFEGYFDALYQGRTTLNEAYGTTFDEMTEEEFKQFYVDLYGCESFDAMLDIFTENAYDYVALEEPLDKGIFSLKGDRIDCVSLGDGESGDIEVVISGDNGEHMMLTYSDGVENYDRAG